MNFIYMSESKRRNTSTNQTKRRNTLKKNLENKCAVITRVGRSWNETKGLENFKLSRYKILKSPKKDAITSMSTVINNYYQITHANGNRWFTRLLVLKSICNIYKCQITLLAATYKYNFVCLNSKINK